MYVCRLCSSVLIDLYIYFTWIHTHKYMHTNIHAKLESRVMRVGSRVEGGEVVRLGGES